MAPFRPIHPASRCCLAGRCHHHCWQHPSLLEHFWASSPWKFGILKPQLSWTHFFSNPNFCHEPFFSLTLGYLRHFTPIVGFTFDGQRDSSGSTFLGGASLRGIAGPNTRCVSSPQVHHGSPMFTLWHKVMSSKIRNPPSSFNLLSPL